ncbi:MAG: hypothetical protein KAU94_01160 [Verrucomicrobia bacterium]|nr:hypothetical protein [Verrucomicrobiota bacterium]
MKKSNHIGLFTAAFVLLAVSVQSATLFYDDFASWLVGDADGKVVPANGTLSDVTANPGVWYKNDWGSFFALTTATGIANQAPQDSTAGAALRVGYNFHNTNYTRTVTIDTGVTYDMNTNYTFSLRAKVYSNDGSVPDGSEHGQIQISSGYWNVTNMVWVKGGDFVNLAATAWQTNSVVSNGARISPNAYGKSIILRLTRKANNSTNFFTWVDWVQIDGVNPYVDWATGEGLSSMDRTADEDGDGVDNFTEWSNGGNPNDPGDTGIAGPGFIVDGTNRFAFVTPRQADYWPNGVDYYLEMNNEGLINGSWINADSWSTGVNAKGFNADFDAVTNLVGNVESNDMQFLRLRFTHPDYNP